MTIVILGIVAAGMLIIRMWDEPLSLNGWEYLGILTAAVLMKKMIPIIISETGGGCLLLSVVGGCLLLACVTDLMICQVYNFTWWPALSAAAILLWQSLWTSKISEPKEILISLLTFLILQFALFGRMYGRADGYAFCVCAIVEASRGMKAAGFLAHMLLSYTLLLLVQAVRENLNKRGNLKKPVPFLPYITISFWLVAILGVLAK